MPTLFSLPPHIYVFAALLGVLLLAFAIFSLLPSFVVSRQLSAVINKLAALKGVPDGSLEQIFLKAGVLEHLWREYADSLHKQLVEGQAIRLRSTLPASVVFRPEILVDIPLRTDFFKHLPGLFTGVGIIGTFYGLLIGLQSFVVSENPVIVRASLTRLLHGVSEAFLVSAVAITLAMVVTFIEKLVLTRLNAQVEQLAQLLDGMFESGAGEEYLARLVQASESSSMQTAGLLQGELKQILTELTEKQIAATHAGTIALGDRITASIEASMKAPLTEISNALKNASHDQGAALQTMLASMFENFNHQMKDLFGGQAADMSSLQKQTIDALQAAVVSMERMAGNVGSAGQRSAEAMAQQLAAAIAAAESRQSVMEDNLAKFVEQMRLATSQSQGEAQQQLQSALNELSGRMGSVIDGLSAQVLATTDVSRKHQQDLLAQSKDFAGQFSGQMTDVIDGVNRAVAEMKSAVLAMRNTTGEAMLGFNKGADTLILAAQDFARAGQGVSSALDKTALVAGQLTQAAGNVAAASSGLGEMFADYRGTRDSMIELVGSLQLLVEQVRREASLSGEVITRIESATGKLVAAQQNADSYLTKVSEVIAVAHESFSEGMVKAVGEANRDFHQALSDSVKLLREGIHELESTLDAATSI
ncbi:MAG: hypothetical protein Q8L80_09585 [Gallionella sp.]|nr:hypothetical protein [Gallionella sp.]MDP1941797.1 hypothetical protein [Gallionella sp.]